MADLLPSSSDVSGPESDEPRVVGVDSDAADELLSALSSRTARRILTELHEEPASPAALAERVDTSLQNTQYHLEKLVDAELVEVADTVYSEKGREMRVYAPADRALVVVAGREEDTVGLMGTLKRLLGGVGVLGVASLVVDRVLGGPTARLFASGGGADGTPAGGNGGSGGSAGGSSLDTGADAGATTASHYQGQNVTFESGSTAAPSVGGDGGGAVTAADATSSGGHATGTSVATSTSTASTTSAHSTVTHTAQATATPPDVQASYTTRATHTAHTAVDGAANVDPASLHVLATSPGLLFFLGGLTVLLLVVFAVSVRR